MKSVKSQFHKLTSVHVSYSMLETENRTYHVHLKTWVTSASELKFNFYQPFKELAKHEILFRIMMANIRCIEVHAKCYKPFARQVMTITLHNYKKVIKNICNSEKGRKGKRYFVL